jgi:hypothetical protein
MRWNEAKDDAENGDYEDGLVEEDPTLGDAELDEDYLSDDGEYYFSGELNLPLPTVMK